MCKNSKSGRDVYVEDDVFRRVYACADQPTRDAMDLAYLAGQRPQNTLSYDERDTRHRLIAIDRGKTGQKLRIEVVGVAIGSRGVVDQAAGRSTTRSMLWPSTSTSTSTPLPMPIGLCARIDDPTTIQQQMQHLTPPGRSVKQKLAEDYAWIFQP